MEHLHSRSFQKHKESLSLQHSLMKLQWYMARVFLIEWWELNQWVLWYLDHINIVKQLKLLLLLEFRLRRKYLIMSLNTNTNQSWIFLQLASRSHLADVNNVKQITSVLRSTRCTWSQDISPCERSTSQRWSPEDKWYIRNTNAF